MALALQLYLSVSKAKMDQEAQVPDSPVSSRHHQRHAQKKHHHNWVFSWMGYFANVLFSLLL
jgi:hypothetical protein